MRYGNPSIKKGMEVLQHQGVTEVLLIPLYPQFAMATTETILVLAEQLKKEYFPEMELTSLPPFTITQITYGCWVTRSKKHFKEKIGSIYCSPTTGFQSVIFVNQILPNHIAKWMENVVLQILPPMPIVTVISVK